MQLPVQVTPIITVLVILVLDGCAGTRVRETREVSQSGLPRPQQVLVHDFAVTPDEVKENSAFFSRLARGFEPSDRTAEEIRIGREVADALATELTVQIQAWG